MWHDLVLFTGALAVSAALPGPDTMLLFSRAVGSGARSAAQVACGLILGKLVLLTAASAGLTVAVTTLGPYFVVLKVAGGGYLVWVAARLLRRSWAPTAAAPPASAAGTADAAGLRAVGLGALLALTNPQALLFYVAVLPTVLEGDRVSPAHYVLLCGALVVVMTAVALGYIGLALRARSVLSGGRRRRADQAGAALLGVTGVLVALR